MKLKRFRGRDVREAMDRVRRELGPDAVIVGTRHVIEGGIWGFFGRAAVEVTAVTTADVKRDREHDTEESRLELEIPRETPSFESYGQRTVEGERVVPEMREERVEKESQAERPATEKGEPDLVGWRHAAGLTKSRGTGAGDAFIPLSLRLATDGSGEELPRRAVFLGPAGAGKTSALGRLAWYHSGRERTMVLSLEEEGRLSGSERLREFWQCLGVEYRPCSAVSEIAAVLRGTHGAVLVDTPPLPWREKPPWLTELLAELEGWERFLVVNAHVDGGEFRAFLSSHGELRPFTLVLASAEEATPRRIEILARAARVTEYYRSTDPSITEPLIHQKIPEKNVGRDIRVRRESSGRHRGQSGNKGEG